MTAWGKSGFTGGDVPQKRKMSIHEGRKLFTVLEVNICQKKTMDPTSQSQEQRNVKHEAFFL